MGHVDHGKTTLLDAIRETSVVDDRGRGHHPAHRRLPGGGRRSQDHVPRHAGSRGVHGHARPRREGDRHRRARRRSRRRRHAADARVDLARPRRRGADRRRRQQDRRSRTRTSIACARELAAEGLQPEEWGGNDQFAEVSAKQKLNLDELLEKVLLVADAELDLRANPNADASGPIIESRLDVGRGPVATMLVHRGTLRVGDAIVAGDASGKVRALYDYRGEKVKDAQAGRACRDPRLRPPAARGRACRVVEHERQAKDLAQKRAERLRREQLAQRSKRGVSLEAFFSQLQEGIVQDLNIVLKARRAGLGRGTAQGAREDPSLRGARQRHPHGCRRHHGERRQPRLGLGRPRDRLQRAAERRGARARRA